MIKLLELLAEVEQDKLDEGWKENVLAAAVAASSLIGGIKAQSNAPNSQAKPTQSQQAATSKIVDLGSVFPSGRYIIRGADEKQLASKLAEIGNYVAANPSADFKIEIVSSESQVPNYDAEVAGKPKLQTGELAKKRAAVAEFAISNFLNDLKSEGRLKGNIDVVTKPILIGDVKFKKGVDNKDDSAYTKDQYVKVNIITSSKSTSIGTIYANMGQEMYMNNRLFGISFATVRAGRGEFKSNQLDATKQTVLFKVVKPNTAIPSNVTKNDSKYFSDVTYVIPYQDWYKAVGTSNAITQNMLDKWENYKIK